MAVLYFGGERLSDQIHYLLASSSGGDLAPVPQPRSSAGPNSAPADLAEMPALVTTDGTTPESWPELSPADLLAQSTGLGDRALKDTAFDQPPWRRFARPFAAAEGKPLLGFLMTGLGIDRAATAAAIAGLPPEVSLSFSPEAKDLGQWIAAARAFGHEALVDLPLQSKDRRALGAAGILIGLNAGEAARRLQAIADAAPAVFGFASDGGDALLLDDGTTAILAAEIARLGLAFIDASGEPMSQILPAARESGLAAARSTVTLDARPSRTAITERLAAATEVAQEEGRALAVAKVSPLTITLLADWLRRTDEQSPVPAPASALLQR
ncbi:divergent polysaccharide deacetylase family protein [Dongia sp.]|uniref:divergent polysaccharide deacetylase family protein n=1 Tax=Dongia sp. TaxID=1977262 RepID=UPI003753BBF6